ncbi:MAG: T9SS type A sorting domain-containing protein [Bacteroidota bacterium]
MAQMQASGFGFNYFDREAIFDAGDGAGYSFYAGVWPIMQQYPGPDHFQLGLPSTWLRPLETGNEPSNFYNTIEGGLGWWHDTRFATETPKFIMGGVAFDFNQWANGVGAGSSDLLADGHRDWSEPGGKYGVAQLSPHLLWPPDGLNMEQGTNGAFLGYGYHPLPLTDPMAQTYGTDFSTGNQCWTLFLNTSNFKGPATFFLPTFWTETVLDDPSLEGLFFDTRPSDKNPAFAMEYAESPALIGMDDSGQRYARVLPLVYPKTTANRSELIRDLKVYSKEAKWNAVENWFNGGPVPPTEFQTTATQSLLFDVDLGVNGHIGNFETTSFEAMIDHDPFAEKIMNTSRTVAGFEWNTNVVEEVGENFIMPEFYQLNSNNQWDPIAMSAVPAATGLLTNEPAITPRNDETPYLTPLEPDCHLQDPQSPWNSPGPSAGPFKVNLGDGSELTYYWYRFMDQPAIVHANLPEAMRQKMQDRIEKIHSHWQHTEEYLPAPTGGTLVSLDPGLIVNPPAGMEIGYVPIVTRQEKTTIVSSTTTVEQETDILLYPNPTKGWMNIESKEKVFSSIQLFSAIGKLLHSWEGLHQNNVRLALDDQSPGLYFINITDHNGKVSVHRIVKSE